MHVDEDGLEYEPEMAPTSAEEDNNEIDLSQSNASPATPVLEAEDTVPNQAKRRRLELLESKSKAVLIYETVESTGHGGEVAKEDHTSRRNQIEK